MAAVQTFKKQYSFKACIAAVADPGEGLGGPDPPLFFYRNEARMTENNFLERAFPLFQGQLTADRPLPRLQIIVVATQVAQARNMSIGIVA